MFFTRIFEKMEYLVLSFCLSVCLPLHDLFFWFKFDIFSLGVTFKTFLFDFLFKNTVELKRGSKLI